MGLTPEMTSDFRIETDRLILRTVTFADVAQVASICKLDEGPVSIAEAEEEINWIQSNHAKIVPGKLIHLCLAIILKESGEFIGWCGLDHRDASLPDPALFYLLKSSHWGKGLATEAARGLVHFAFKQLGLASIHSGAAFENIASKRVMEKLGMKYHGLDEEGGYAFTITQDEYFNSSSLSNVIL